MRPCFQERMSISFFCLSGFRCVYNNTCFKQVSWLQYKDFITGIVSFIQKEYPKRVFLKQVMWKILSRIIFCIVIIFPFLQVSLPFDSLDWGLMATASFLYEGLIGFIAATLCVNIVANLKKTPTFSSKNIHALQISRVYHPHRIFSIIPNGRVNFKT